MMRAMVNIYGFDLRRNNGVTASRSNNLVATGMLMRALRDLAYIHDDSAESGGRSFGFCGISRAFASGRRCVAIWCVGG